MVVLIAALIFLNKLWREDFEKVKSLKQRKLWKGMSGAIWYKPRLLSKLWEEDETINRNPETVNVKVEYLHLKLGWVSLLVYGWALAESSGENLWNATVNSSRKSEGICSLLDESIKHQKWAGRRECYIPGEVKTGNYTLTNRTAKRQILLWLM